MTSEPKPSASDETMKPARRAREPGPFTWTLAVISLVLPWVGAGLALWGAHRIAHGNVEGWTLVGIGLALIVLDVIIDFVWANPTVSPSDEPNLNRPGRRLVGATGYAVGPMAAGNGQIRIGGSLWRAEGPDMADGTAVVVVGVRDTVLVVDVLKGSATRGN